MSSILLLIPLKETDCAVCMAYYPTPPQKLSLKWSINNASLLSIQNLSVDFISESGTTHALKNISFSVNRGEIVALVGESGSGKSVTALSIFQLLPSPLQNIHRANIIFSEDGNETNRPAVLKEDRIHYKHIRGNKIAMIFQEPMTSLNPVLTCGEQVMEALLST